MGEKMYKDLLMNSGIVCRNNQYILSLIGLVTLTPIQYDIYKKNWHGCYFVIDNHVIF